MPAEDSEGQSNVKKEKVVQSDDDKLGDLVSDHLHNCLVDASNTREERKTLEKEILEVYEPDFVISGDPDEDLYAPLDIGSEHLSVESSIIMNAEDDGDRSTPTVHYLDTMDGSRTKDEFASLAHKISNLVLSTVPVFEKNAASFSQSDLARIYKTYQEFYTYMYNELDFRPLNSTQQSYKPGKKSEK
ncbi:uncharacterized protein J8A68_002508 [[Candida] subhashii]|uniref:Uncharacterized protein n=1 Tax=[Candida] subhashii TaxID=561895 RepID=A0A8J5UQ25_9ASCO|nr:uncharacterized protein J8A68_002508 [[Candida] subhashii]KAG7663947.1 hypothetical protein J8A68_002508 [[Candida] subhashii]